jgi:hypothetical protein
MARGGRRKVSIYDQRDRANKKWVKSVCKAVTPSKRTQRAIAKAIIFSAPSGSTVQPTYKERTPYKQASVKWKDARPTLLQWAGCFAVALVCLCPILSIWKLSNDISEISILLIVFFGIPFLVATLCVVDYNKTKYRSYRLKDTADAPDLSSHTVPASIDKPASEEATAEIDRMNAKIFMDEFQDSLSIMQKTTNPETFFSRYDLAMERLDNMVELQQKGIKFTSDLSSLKAQALSRETTADTVNVLIDNAYIKQLQNLSTLKTERGRTNSNQRWYASFEPYFDKMPVRSRNYLDLKLEELKEV